MDVFGQVSPLVFGNCLGEKEGSSVVEEGVDFVVKGGWGLGLVKSEDQLFDPVRGWRIRQPNIQLS